MTVADIQQLITCKTLPDHPESIKLIETHAAWVLLTKHYAYKIKKPVLFSFLDFSTIEKRHFFCERELVLNRRLAPNVYLKVWPIKRYFDQIYIGENAGEIVDYCLQMKRMDSSKEMNKLLIKNEVTEKDVQEIAVDLAAFHKKAEIIFRPFDKQRLKNDFADILTVAAIVEVHCGYAAGLTLRDGVQFSEHFLNKFLPRLAWRQQNGYVRDVHGDLHSGNIFLLDRPIIFDCIEFSDSFRQIDLLSEVAFLCMDLEYHSKSELSDSFLNSYLKHFPCIYNEADRQLLLFFKWYRAGIRLKVNCLQFHSEMDKKENVIHSIQQYFYLFEKYFKEINSFK